MPAIVLMNPDHAVDLLKLFDEKNMDPQASFWRQRSILYVMGIIPAYIDFHHFHIQKLELFLHFILHFRRTRVLPQADNRDSR